MAQNLKLTKHIIHFLTVCNEVLLIVFKLVRLLNTVNINELNGLGKYLLRANNIRNKLLE